MIDQGTLLNYVAGKWQASSATEKLPIRNPATGRSAGRRTDLTGAGCEQGGRCARDALATWRRTPPGDRIQPLFKLKALLDTHFKELARVITLECGKTLAEAEGELKRGHRERRGRDRHSRR